MLGIFMIITAVARVVSQEAEEPVSYTASALLTYRSVTIIDQSYMILFVDPGEKFQSTNQI